MIIAVNSFDEAKNYPVMFGASELFMDNNRDVFYIKSVDRMGKYVMSTYAFQQIENERPLTAENFVTRDQFNQQFGNLASKLDLLINELGVGKSGEQYSISSTDGATGTAG